MFRASQFVLDKRQEERLRLKCWVEEAFTAALSSYLLLYIDQLRGNKSVDLRRYLSYYGRHSMNPSYYALASLDVVLVYKKKK